jgi:GNAT superfamily N-acetyltransferase
VGGAHRRANRVEALAEIASGGMRGYLARDGEHIVGWLNAGDLSAYRLLAPELTPLTGGQKTGMTICFVVDPAHRNRGVARLLLDAAIEGFRAQGYDAVLALSSESDIPEKRYRGTLRMYQERGFLPLKHGDLSLMRLALR